MRERAVVRVAIAALLGLAVAAAGCQAIAEKAVRTGVEKATGVKVDEDSGSITVTDKEGNTSSISSTGEGELPKDLPKDLPVYEGTPSDGVKGEDAEGVSWMFSVMTKDTVRDVNDWYKSELEDKGWEISSSNTWSNDGEGAMITAKKDGLELTLAVADGEGEANDRTKVSVVLVQKKQ